MAGLANPYVDLISTLMKRINELRIETPGAVPFPISLGVACTIGVWTCPRTAGVWSSVAKKSERRVCYQSVWETQNGNNPRTTVTPP